MASEYGKVAHLLNPNYKGDVTKWLAEDCPSFDYGGFVVGDGPGEAKLLGKSAVSEGRHYQTAPQCALESRAVRFCDASVMITIRNGSTFPFRE